ncbi:MAG: succinyl-diaminopimelate desuccinylase [Proteobacteria bacterium]|nr:succinyl-diaminopimelate desuccinylase [Pseudomonadota bacterium]
MNSATLDLTVELLKRRSVTPDDAGCLDVIAARLTACGFRTEFLNFAGVTNLWATHGGGLPVFTFAGHTDVVPTGDLALWSSDPFKPEIRDGFLFGRGAADMKGSLAAMVTAIENFLARDHSHRGTISLLLTSDEEGVATDGTVRVIESLQARGQQITWCVVGEPSSELMLGDCIRNGRRGSLNGRLTIRGIQGHVAYPERAANPIHLIAPALSELCANHWDDGNEFYPPTSFQISNINSGTGADNVIPGSLEACFNFRFCTESTVADLQCRVNEILPSHNLDYSIDWHLSGDAFLTSGGSLLANVRESIREHLGIESQASTGGGTSDGRFIARTGAEIVEFGPVNATIHKIDECVSVEDLDLLSVTYQSILSRLMRD